GGARASEARIADSVDRLADVLGNLGVLIGLIGVRMGLLWADAAAALIVAVIIVRAAGILTWRSGDILIDRAPAGAEEDLRGAIRNVDGVREVRSVRVRRSGPNLIGDASIATGRMLSVEAVSALVEDVKARARSVLPPLELAVTAEGQKQGAGLDVTARNVQLAARIRAIVEAHPEVKRCVDVELSSRQNQIHAHVVAEVAGEVSLEHAHRIESELEETIRREIPGIHEVVTRAT